MDACCLGIVMGECGVDFFDLIEEGHLSPKKRVAMLRKSGAIIAEEMISFVDNWGESHPAVPKYFYKGWIV